MESIDISHVSLDTKAILQKRILFAPHNKSTHAPLLRRNIPQDPSSCQHALARLGKFSFNLPHGIFPLSAVKSHRNLQATCPGLALYLPDTAAIHLSPFYSRPTQLSCMPWSSVMWLPLFSGCIQDERFIKAKLRTWRIFFVPITFRSLWNSGCKNISKPPGRSTVELT